MELDRRLGRWAAARRLSDVELASIRTRVIGEESFVHVNAVTVVDAAPGFDADWLWCFLRPVTDLMEQTAEYAESRLSTRFSFFGDDTYQPYLRLA